MLKRSESKVSTLIAIFSAVAAMLISTYAMRYQINILQSIAFILIYNVSTRQEKPQALLSILIFILLAIFIREPIQATESIRGVLFSLMLIYLCNNHRKITPSLCLMISWFIYLSLQLLPINFITETIYGVFPVATSKTIEIMLLEIIGLSFLEIILSTKTKSSESLFGYQANLLIFTNTINLLIIFYLTKNTFIPSPNTELRELSNLSTAIMLNFLSLLLIINLIALKFSSTFENLFSHLELCATPDSGFLTLTKKPALMIKEFVNYSKSIRKKSEALTNTRKKSTELKVELNSIKRQLQELNDRSIDLNIMADSLNIGLLAITHEGTITYVNKTFYEMLNLEISHAEMLHFHDLINNRTKQSEAVCDAIEEVLGSGNSFKIKCEDLSIQVTEWKHHENRLKKSNLGNNRILVFIKKLDSDSKINLASTPEL